MRKFLKNMARRAFGALGYEVVAKSVQDAFTLSLDESDAQIIRSVGPYTMTPPQVVFATIQAARYIVRRDIPGAIVECGVWRGGSMMAAALALKALGSTDRHLYLFDTFAGMPRPTEHDITFRGRAAVPKFENLSTSADSSNWCAATLDEVREALLSTGYEESRLHFIEGKVEATIPEHAPQEIALLRLDTDWYESSRHELEHLYPRLSPKGVLILDDYGHWLGVRKAVDEYLANNSIDLLLNRVSHAACVAVKA